MAVLTSIIRTTRTSNNPCVINAMDTRKILNLDKFLENTFLAIHSSFMEKNNSIQDFFYHQKGYSYYTPAVAYIFDQFLLERLTGINFINSLYQQSMKIPDSITKILAHFISSPLCNARMKMLDYQVKLIGDSEFHEYISHEWYEELWGKTLQILLEYHLNCTLPVLDLMYHYMMGLAFEKSLIPSKEHYMKSMDDYFFSVCKSSDENNDKTASKENNHNDDEFLFFRENNNKIIIPKRCAFPLKDMNPNISYDTFASIIYRQFYHDMARRADNNLFRILEQSDIRNIIIEKFSMRLTNSFPPVIENLIKDGFPTE